MDIAIYHPWIHTQGGAEKILLELLENSEHNITIYTTNYKPDETFPEFRNYDIKVIGNLPIKGYLLRGLTFTLTNFLTKLPMEKHDALVVSTAGVAEMINYRNHDKPVIGYCHTPLKAARDPVLYQQNLEEKGFLMGQVYQLAVKIYKMLEKPAWKYFDHVQFNSQHVRERATKPGLIEKDKTSVNHPGTDTKDKMPGNYDHYFFLPGRFVEYKNHDIAIEAFKKFQNWNADQNFKLVIAGSLQDEKQEYYSKIKRKTHKNPDIEVKTNVPGKEWEQLYRNCYSVLFPSKNEDWGIIPIEAQAYGKPVIAVDKGGPKESIKDEMTGLLVNPEPNAFAEAMNRIVKEPELLKKMGKNAIENAENYTWEDFVQKFDQQITETVKQQ